MKYAKEIIQEKYAGGEMLKYIFFWGHKPSDSGDITKSCLSQWYECKFTSENIEYHTAEQYMMSQKALLFNDKEIYNRIMKADNPGEYKSLGRKIKNFDENIWNEHRTEIVLKGNIAKFSQNTGLRDFLLNTGSRILAEASPYDRIWGIGMAQNENGIENPYNWKGDNLLGFCLMETRDILRETSYE